MATKRERKTLEDMATGDPVWTEAVNLLLKLETESEEQRIQREWALLDYDNGDTGCPNCHRSRLCICTNGKHRCEKCNWSPELNGYAPVVD